MTDKEKTTIQAVIRTLDSLTLTGRENMGKVLGCINALEDMLEVREKEEAKQE